ncbi:LLM class F420-dependent oxidoreductase [Streptomyces rhizosphaericus]|uniref:LLM class F420-dependent oxidoreductase n=1 Tax=Streptomyces rhizosphaericus TaxID=114699 RepID=UPI000A363623|nr:LLM class F420-dependent oxidoreductase [Streptomyces rhizosphaericus]
MADSDAVFDNLPQLSVALGLWPERPAKEALITAQLADRLGFKELWIGDRETSEVLVLATAIAGVTDRIPLTLGPLPVAVRDPVSIARAAATISHFNDAREVRVALGAGSKIVVSHWHGRDHGRAATALGESAQALRGFLTQGQATINGDVVRTRGYRMHLKLPSKMGTPTLTIAAFGPRTLRVAAAHSDRLVLAFVTPEIAAGLSGRLAEEAAAARRACPTVAAWVPVAVIEGPDTGPDQEAAAVEQLRRTLVGYLAAPGYAEAFTRAGFGNVVALAQSQPRPHPEELRQAIPLEMVRKIGIFGDRQTVRQRLCAFGDVIEEVAVLPCSTEYDPAGARTLEALRDMVPGEPMMRPARER